MVCGGNNGHGTSNDNCVCSVLRAIADAQTEPTTTGPCVVSCERSIQELLGQVSPTSTRPNTVPVILQCGCEPFLGTGVTTTTTNQGTQLTCVQSFVFRVTSVDDNCCAVLELLQTFNHAGQSGNLKIIDVDPQEGPCSQFPTPPGQAAEGFIRTGICITVDLNCFCGVTCLDAVLAPPAV